MDNHEKFTGMVFIIKTGLESKQGLANGVNINSMLYGIFSNSTQSNDICNHILWIKPERNKKCSFKNSFETQRSYH